MKKKIKKRALTLLEIMIVIFLITIITTVISYNLKGTTLEGKAFKTSESARRIHEILSLETAKGTIGTERLDRDIIDTTTVKEILERSGLVKNAEAMLKDGWGKPFTITKIDGDFIIKSAEFQKYCESKGMTRDQMIEKYEFMFEKG